MITARYGSTRLRGKVLKPFWKNLSVLEFLIKRLQTQAVTSRLALATVANEENDAIAAVGLKYGIKVARGPEEDVLGRMALAIEGEDAPFIGRVTGDNPLTDPLLAIAQWEEMKKIGADYSYCRECPVGTAMDLWTRKSFEESVREATTAYQREHVNAWVWDHPERYKILWHVPRGEWRKKEITVTLDTQEHLEGLQRKIEGVLNPLRMTLNEIVANY